MAFCIVFLADYGLGHRCQPPIGGDGEHRAALSARDTKADSTADPDGARAATMESITDVMDL
jgi:hypothetical protein